MSQTTPEKFRSPRYVVLSFWSKEVVYGPACKSKCDGFARSLNKDGRLNVVVKSVRELAA